MRRAVKGYGRRPRLSAEKVEKMYTSGAKGADPVWRRVVRPAQARVLRGLWAAAGRLDPDRSGALVGALFATLGPRTADHRRLLANLRVVRPSAEPAELDRLARACWRQFGRVVGEYPHLARLAEEPGRVELVDRFGLGRAAAGRPAMLVGAHLANWELPAAVTARAGVPMTVVHAPRADPRVQALLERQRTALGCRFLAKEAGPHALLEELRAGRSIGLLLDQRHDGGEWVRFFGRPASVPIAPAAIAARLGVPFVPARVERLAGARFRLTVEPPIEPLRTGDPRARARDMMQRLYALFEAWIAERPEEWLCIKRRWPDFAKAKWRERLATDGRFPGDTEPPPDGPCGLDRHRPLP
jgi:KDO2-lipid IV(A) lauroyltransferase